MTGTLISLLYEHCEVTTKREKRKGRKRASHNPTWFQQGVGNAVDSAAIGIGRVCTDLPCTPRRSIKRHIGTCDRPRLCVLLLPSAIPASAEDTAPAALRRPRAPQEAIGWHDGSAALRACPGPNTFTQWPSTAGRRTAAT
jgi:hypothetical protein